MQHTSLVPLQTSKMALIPLYIYYFYMDHLSSNEVVQWLETKEAREI